MENENNNSNLNSANNIQPQFNNSNGYGDVNFQNSDPYASQINSNLSSFNDNTISYNNDSQISTVDNNQYNSMPGMDFNNQYNSMPGMDFNDQYGSMPGMNSNDQYGSMSGMDSNDQFSSMPGMNSNDQYGSMPGMNSNDQYSSMPGMDSNDQFSSMPGMDSNDQYNNMPSMDSNNQYSSMPGMDSSNQYGNMQNMDSNDQFNSTPSNDYNQYNMDSNDQFGNMPGMDSNDQFNAMQNNDYNQYNMNSNNQYDSIPNNDFAQYNNMPNADSNDQFNNNDSYLMNQYNNEYGTNPNYNMDYNQNNFDQNMNYNSNDYIEPMDVPGYDQSQGQLNPQYYDANNTSEQNYNNEQSSNSIGNIDEEFMKNWMGNFYTKSNSKFNIFAFLFGPIYFLYRKVTTFGIIFLAINALLLSAMSFLAITSPLTSLALVGTISLILTILFVVYGFIFNGLYKGFVKSKQQALSATMDSNQLLDYAKQKGGTSVLGTILGISIIVIVVMISNIIGISIKSDSLNKKTKTTTITPENTVKTPVVTPEKQLSEYTFKAGSANTTYALSYNSSIWTFNQATNSLTLQNGDVFKYADNYIEKLSTTINTTVSTEQGRATFFNLYTNAFAESATQSNGTSTPSPQGFVQKGTNIYYAYNDIVVNNTVTRYYLLLIPSIDMNFQFTLTSQLSSIDLTENAEIEKIFETFTTPTNSSILTQPENTVTSSSATDTTGTHSTTGTNTTTNTTTTTNNQGTTSGTSSSSSTSSTGTTNSGVTTNQTGVDYTAPSTSSPSNAITSTTTDLNSVI